MFKCVVHFELYTFKFYNRFRISLNLLIICLPYAVSSFL